MKSKSITVDFLHPTVVRAFTNWGYICFFGCIALLITLLFFAISQVKQADEVRQRPGVAASSSDQNEVYENRDAGFTLRYPTDIRFLRDREAVPSDAISLSIRSELINSLNGPMGYTKDVAEGDSAALNRGEYGRGISWSVSSSKKVRNLGEINGQDFVVFGRFEVCDVTFERKLIFYSNGYQNEVTLHGNRDAIIPQNQRYFGKDPVNCGNQMVWQVKESSGLYADIVSGSASGEAQRWYNLFDEIVDSIEVAV
jgi:hypothetical protein